MNLPLRVGVVGLGFGQHAHVPAFRSDDRCIVVAVAGRRPDRAKAVAARLDIPRAYDDWRELVTDHEVDVVSVAVPPLLQGEIVRAAARAHKHVFCEKPMAMNVSEARAMLAAVRKAGVVHAVDFEFAEIPAWQTAKSICAGDQLGRIRNAALTWRVQTLVHREQKQTWKATSDQGGGALNNFGSHALYLMEWLFGRACRLAARLRPKAPADAGVDVWFEFHSGIDATLSIATDAFMGPGHMLEIYGDQATLRVKNATSDYIRNFVVEIARRDEPGFSEVALDPLPLAPDGRISAVSRLVRRFVDAILVGAGGESRPNLEDGVRVQILIDAIRRADLLGRWQRV